MAQATTAHLVRKRGLARGAGLVRGLARWSGLGLIAATCACFSPVHAPTDLLDAGFKTPRQTFETFKTALDLDLPTLEYRCFAASFTRANNLSVGTYLELRDQLFDEQPLLRLVAQAEIVAEEQEGVGEHRLEARIAGRTLRVRCVREDFFEIWTGDRRAADGWLARGGQVASQRGPRATPRTWVAWSSELGADAADASTLWTRISSDDPDAFSGLDPATITEVRVGHEWKIADVWEAAEASAP